MEVVNEENSSLNLEEWGLPDGVLNHYKKKGICRMFQWQMECLSLGSILDGENLIYSAPTSAGKTLVAEILITQTVFEKQKKALVILPFVSVVREKMYYFQEMFSESGIRVEGFMGGHTPTASFQQVQVGVCTIEKANSLINRMLEEKTLSKLGIVVVDELHLLGDPYRGYLLELLLTKLKYMSATQDDINLQIVGMSATLPNLNILAKWLNAKLYFTDFRPVPLEEHLKCGKTIMTKNLQPVAEISPEFEEGDDSENVGQLCIETIRNGHSTLIFCPTKVWCENLALKLAAYFRKLGCSKEAEIEETAGWVLRQQLDLTRLNAVVVHLKESPVGLDKDLAKCVPFGVAFHHAGLTLDERDVIEGSFRNGSLRVLCATSTLSSGVNLPARRVIIRSPISFGGVMDVMTYRQMVGRAGRMGVDTHGESILICKPGEKTICQKLMSSNLKPIESCLGSGRLSASLKRAVLEVVASGIATTKEQLSLYAAATFLAASSRRDMRDPLSSCVEFLIEHEMIRCTDGASYVPTPLGEACLASSLPPDEGLALFRELERARRCFVLDSDLHIIYQITPYSVSEQWTKIDWFRVLNMLEDISPSMRRVANLVGIEDSFLVKVVKGSVNTNNLEHKTKLSIHRRFYTALALHELVNEVPLTEVAEKFDCNKGMMQSLQQSAATYAGMVAEFAKRLRWGTMELIVGQFQERLQFGVQRELCELMRLPSLNGIRARALFNAGIKTLSEVANNDVAVLESVLLNATPFQSRGQGAGESDYEAAQRTKLQSVWVTGRAGLSVTSAAEMLIKEAREILQLELGVSAKWGDEGHNRSSLVSEGIKIMSPSQKKNSSKCVDHSINSSYNKARGEPQSMHHHQSSSSIIYKPETSLSLEKASPIIMATGELSRSIEPVKLEYNAYYEDQEMKPSVQELSQTIVKVEDVAIPSEMLIDVIKTENSPEAINLDPIVDVVEARLNKVAHRTRFSTDLFDLSPKPYSTPIQGSRLVPFESPDIFNQSLTFDTQIQENCESAEIAEFAEDYPSSPQKSDDLGYLSDSPIVVAEFCGESSKPVYDILSSNVRKRKASPDLIIGSDDSLPVDKRCGKKRRQGLFKKKSRRELRRSVTAPVLLNTEDSDNEQIAPTPPRIQKACSFEVTTPSKRKKTNMGDSPKSRNYFTVAKAATEPGPSCQMADENVAFGPSILESVDWNTINVIDVCGNREVFQSFLGELKDQKIIGIAVGCCKNTNFPEPRIGAKFKKQKGGTSKTVDDTNALFFCDEFLIDGVAFYWTGNDVFYVKCCDVPDDIGAAIKEMLRELLCGKTVICAFDVKEQLSILMELTGFRADCSIRDPKVAFWLCSISNAEGSITSMVKEYLPEGRMLSALVGKSIGYVSPALDVLSSTPVQERACSEAFLTSHLLLKLEERLCQRNLLEVFRKVEMPTQFILAEMEVEGFFIDVQRLKNLKTELKHLVSELERNAHELAGRRFSLSSLAAVGKILFNELKLSKSSLTGKNKALSTSKESLELLESESNHPLPRLILQWRKIQAILNNTLSLLLHNLPTRIVHCSCQTFTVTGRITMREPNLQTIPRDFEVLLNTGKVKVCVRDVFVAKPGFTLLSADYCQVELRLLAHLAQDDSLIESISASGDIFVRIAAEIFGISESEVTDEDRQRAKQTCYGIIYGIGSRSLALQLGIAEETAQNLMTDFMGKYKNVKKFLNETVSDCRKSGYIVTLSGRRRYLAGINSVKSSERSEAERQAINSRVQGSAADLIKKAMVSVRNHSDDEMKLVLHLHDELIYQVPNEALNHSARILKTCMESVWKLSVPLPVKLRSGQSWGKLFPFKIEP